MQLDNLSTYGECGPKLRPTTSVMKEEAQLQQSVELLVSRLVGEARKLRVSSGRDVRSVPR